MDTYEHVTYVTLLSHCLKMSIKIFGCYICPCRSYWKSRVRWSSWDGVPLAWWKSNWTPPEINLLRTGTLEGIESQRKPVRSYPTPFSETFWLIFTSILVQCTRMSKKSHFKMNFSVRHIIPGTFQNLKNLEYLYMDSNRIQRIEPSTFYGLNKLKYLGLSKNYLKALDKVSHFRKQLAGIYAWAIDGACQWNARTDLRIEIHKIGCFCACNLFSIHHNRKTPKTETTDF